MKGSTITKNFKSDSQYLHIQYRKGVAMSVTHHSKSSECGSYGICQAEVRFTKYSVTPLSEYFSTC